MSKLITAFQVENERASLAEKKDFKKLLKTYSKSLPEIKDFNTPRLWDTLNTKGIRGKNPMDDDRVTIVNRLIKGKKIKVLNIGFGSASLEKKFFSRNHKENIDWNGIDISFASVKKARNEVSQVTFMLGNILRLTHEDESFDYVVSLEVLEHIQPRNTFHALREIFRVIKPGKYFIVSVPLNEELEKMLTKGNNPNAHVRVYTPDLIKAELEIVGFKILKKKMLFAFHNFYRFKTLIATYILSKKFNPNNVIILAQKPI